MFRNLLSRLFHNQHYHCFHQMVNTPMRADELTPAHRQALDFHLRTNAQAMMASSNVVRLLVELGRTEELTSFMSDEYRTPLGSTAHILMTQCAPLPSDLAALTLRHYLQYRREALPRAPVHPLANRWSWQSQEVDAVISLSLAFAQKYPSLSNDFAPVLSEYEQTLSPLVQVWGMPSSALPQLRSWLLRHRLMSKAPPVQDQAALPAL